jgi:hypothetical protein
MKKGPLTDNEKAATQRALSALREGVPARYLRARFSSRVLEAAKLLAKGRKSDRSVALWGIG